MRQAQIVLGLSTLVALLLLAGVSSACVRGNKQGVGGDVDQPHVDAPTGTLRLVCNEPPVEGRYYRGWHVWEIDVPSNSVTNGIHPDYEFHAHGGSQIVPVGKYVITPEHLVGPYSRTYRIRAGETYYADVRAGSETVVEVALSEDFDDGEGWEIEVSLPPDVDLAEHRDAGFSCMSNAVPPEMRLVWASGVTSQCGSYRFVPGAYVAGGFPRGTDVWLWGYARSTPPDGQTGVAYAFRPMLVPHTLRGSRVAPKWEAASEFGPEWRSFTDHWLEYRDPASGLAVMWGSPAPTMLDYYLTRGAWIAAHSKTDREFTLTVKPGEPIPLEGELRKALLRPDAPWQNGLGTPAETDKE